MRPIAILQHESTQGPGRLRDYLEENDMPYRIIFPETERNFSFRARGFRGVVVLGSDHCANESLPWILQEQSFLQDALCRDIPILGHCFGAQLMAKAMGAGVRKNTCPNIGWGEVWISQSAQQAMGLPPQAVLFHWHYDTFDIPRGAVRTMMGSHCRNKGFRQARHWAFQGHLEVTQEGISNWCRAGRQELLRAGGPAAQSETRILAELARHLPALHRIAYRTYQAWTRQLDRPLFFAGGAPAWPAGCWQPA
ncbi:type 1 glutamine amidotransferase [Kerstersia sp.]|uniref:type 1 glutamine amidotransferase n=1 Tax=Kerstersia sp. TaxID=1930783 RepID=UPI003F93CB46